MGPYRHKKVETTTHEPERETEVVRKLRKLYPKAQEKIRRKKEKEKKKREKAKEKEAAFLCKYVIKGLKIRCKEGETDFTFTTTREERVVKRAINMLVDKGFSVEYEREQLARGCEVTHKVSTSFGRELK